MINIEITQDQIQEAVNHLVKEVLKQGYSNPIKTAVEAAFKEKQGEVNLAVQAIISESLAKPEFKEELGKAVLESLVSNALTKK